MRSPRASTPLPFSAHISNGLRSVSCHLCARRHFFFFFLTRNLSSARLRKSTPNPRHASVPPGPHRRRRPRRARPSLPRHPARTDPAIAGMLQCAQHGRRLVSTYLIRTPAPGLPPPPPSPQGSHNSPSPSLTPSSGATGWRAERRRRKSPRRRGRGARRTRGRG